MNGETRDKVDNHGVLGITVQSVDSAVSEAPRCSKAFL